MLLLDPPHHHAEVTRFADDPDTYRMDAVLDALRNLLCQSLLDLQSARECIDDPGDLAKTNHLRSGQVGNVFFAEERQHVVLAQAKELKCP